MRKENLRDIFGIKGGLNVIFLIETSRNTIFNLFIEWKIHSYNVIQIFLLILYFLKRIISLDSLLQYIEHARIFFRFRKTYRTLSHGSQTRNCEKLVEICIARHMPGLTRPRTFASGTIPPSLAPKFYSRVVVSQLGSFPPWTICHRVPDRLSHPSRPLHSFSRCAKGVEALGAPLSASKFMNRRLRSPRIRSRSND